MRHKGFSLVELMMVIAILGIIAAIAAPSMADLIAGQRVKDAAFELQATMMLARNEAVKRNASIVITPDAAGWTNGWNVKNPRYWDAADVSKQFYISQRGAFSSNLTITPMMCGATTITFNNIGRLDATVNTKTPRLDVSSVGTAMRRCIQVDLSGRPSVSPAACSASCS